MPQELNLDELSEEMRQQQDGNPSGSQVVWNPRTMQFEKYNRNEMPDGSMSVVNDVSKRPFYTL